MVFTKDRVYVDLGGGWKGEQEEPFIFVTQNTNGKEMFFTELKS